MIKNNFCFTGYAAKDAEERTTKLGLRIASFSVPIKSKDEETTWVQVSCFFDEKKPGARYTFEDVMRVKKGDYVYIEGPLSVESYTGNDGEKRTNLKITAYTMGIMKKKDEQEKPASFSASLQMKQNDAAHDPYADIPF